MGDRKQRVRGDDPKFTAAPVPRGMRKLTIFGEQWLWRYGRTVQIRPPSGETMHVSLCDLLNTSWENIEEAHYDRRLKVEPSTIRDYIHRNVHGYDDGIGYPKGSPGHRMQVEPRKGWTQFEGPRGTWQTIRGAWVTQFMTPEGVIHEARTYDVLDMSVSDWTDVKQAHLESIGSSFDQLWQETKAENGWTSSEKRITVWMEYDPPNMPHATPEQLTTYVVREIVGKAALKLALAA